MNHQVEPLAHEDTGAAIDSGSLDVPGPTARQELFLRRQQLWADDLTREQASRLIDDFLARKHVERQMNRGDAPKPGAPHSE